MTNESLDKLNNLWHKWKSGSCWPYSRFGGYVLDQPEITQKEPRIIDIYYEKNAQLAYDKLYQEVVSGNLVI